ncbi:hypothetical protein EC973_002420 [Apophysomyces ossiformis]|uniref:DUF2421 domain-containing protein n=1 Tax=Apophysomyces ossiformis TaxID=679940 RepID=A0A8H7BMW1_9FUNG|nr:hypothetical protein EC973_002420 [Apophysomyces ossiformis]
MPPKATEEQAIFWTSRKMQDVIDEFDKCPTQTYCHVLDTNSRETPGYGTLYLLFLYLFNLKEYALQVRNLLEFVDNVEQTRKNRRLWFPKMPVKKWFRSSEIDPEIGGDMGDYGQHGIDNELSLVRTLTRTETENNRDDLFNQPKYQQGKLYHRDPDVDPPTTFVQRSFYKLWRFSNWFIEPDTFFAFKTAVGVVLLAIPAFRQQDAAWYSSWRGQWAMITLVLWNFPMAGAFNFSLITRVAGSIAGGILGIVAWEISRGNPYGLAIVLLIIILYCYHVFLFSPTYKPVALMTKVTMILVALYEFQYVAEGIPYHDQVWTVAGKRVLLVVIGLVAAYVLSLIPHPLSGRVELRKRLAKTIRDIGRLYAILASKFMVTGMDFVYPTPDQVKCFHKLSLEIRRQIADGRNLLFHTDYEPPLRGRFPKESYAKILDKVEDMTDLVLGMGHAMRQINPLWRKQIAMTLSIERLDYLTCIMTTLKLLSTTLAAKMALPPYMQRPVHSRFRLAKALETKIQIGPAEIANPSFPAYSSYMLNSFTFVSELDVLLEVVEDLVGVESPEEWLRTHV